MNICTLYSEQLVLFLHFVNDAALLRVMISIIHRITWRKKIANLILMQFLNDIIKSGHGFKYAQKFRSFIVLIKTLNL